jgi:hypothetical protein
VKLKNEAFDRETQLHNLKNNLEGKEKEVKQLQQDVFFSIF